MFLNIYSVLTGELTDVLTYKLLITNILYRQMLTVNLVVLELTLVLTLSQGLSIFAPEMQPAEIVYRAGSLYLLNRLK